MSFVLQLGYGKTKDVVEFCSEIDVGLQSVCYEAAGQGLQAWLKPGQSLDERCDEFPDPDQRHWCKSDAPAVRQRFEQAN
jgi:hypothetical protein